MKVKVDQYIKELLQTHGSVIVADLGKFYTEYKPAKFDESTKQLLPPSEQVFFDPSVKLDSGILMKLISQRENYSTVDAKKEVTSFVNSSIALLKAGQNVPIDQLGYLYMNNGKIEFGVDEQSDLGISSYGLGSVQLNKEISAKYFDSENIPEVKEKLETKSRPVLKIFLVIIPVLLLSLVLLLQLPSGEPIKKKINDYSVEYFNTELNLDLPELNASENALDEETTDNTANKESDVNMSSEETTQETVNNNNTVSTLNGIRVNKSAKSFLISREIIKTEENVLPQVVAIYHLIIGSFSKMENAQIEKQRYENQGYKPLVLAEDKGLIRLSLKQFTNFEQAIDATNTFNDTHTHESVWIFVSKSE